MNSIKDHYLYPVYIEYLKKKRISKGALELGKISEDLFFDFKYQYDTDTKFKDNQDKIYKSIVREDKINTILDAKLNRHTEPK